MSGNVMAYYIRLSVEDGDLKYKEGKTESNSITHQRELLQDYYQTHKELHQYEITEFCDDGYSGTNFRRPGFIRMMEMIKQGQIQGVMVKDLSRFGREYLEVGAYLELILPLYGTRFISVSDGFDSHNYVGTTGGMELALRNLINGMYSKDISVKVKTAIRSRNKQGRYWGGQAFYGYKLHPGDKHKLVVDENVRSYIELIFDLCIQGMSTMQIARRLNELRIPSPAQYKKENGGFYNGRVLQEETSWLGGTVRKILNDERYTGKMISGTREMAGIRSKKMRQLPKEQWIVVEDTHEAMISSEKFAAAKEALSSRIRTVNQNTSGNRAHNIFVCGYCGRKLQRSNGKEVYLYCIQSRSKRCPDCESVHTDLAVLQQKTLSIVRAHADLLLDRTAFIQKNIVTKQEQLQKEIKKCEQRILSITSGKRALYEEYRSGRYTAEAFKKIQAENAGEIEQIKIRIENLKEELEKDLEYQKALICSSEQAGELSMLTEYRPEVVSRLVERVQVFANGAIQITLKNQDVFEQLLKEISNTARAS